jgi:G:T/U-mismatch repair DNA glycosylase
MLVLQSRRMLLSARRTRLHEISAEETAVDIAKLEGAVRNAQERYADAVLRYGSNRSPQYRLVAFTSLIAKGERLRAALNRGSGEVSVADQHELVADLRSLDRLLDGWRQIARESMTAAVP